MQISNEVIAQKLDEIKKLILKVSERSISLKAAAEYLGVKESFMHKLNARNAIRYTKPGGKMVFYKIRRLDSYADKNPVPSQEERERSPEIKDEALRKARKG